MADEKGKKPEVDEKEEKHEREEKEEKEEKKDPEFEPEKDEQGHWWQFERCPHDCHKAQGNGKVSCPDPPNSACAKADCRCRLFKRPAKKNDPWQHEKEGDDGKQIPDDPKMEYECFCVRRVRIKGR